VTPDAGETAGAAEPAPGRRAIRIGITGPIGCGKSTVAGWLAARGAVVVDADAVARSVVEPGEPALALVLARFGDAVRAFDGSLDRAALGRIVFADPDALRDLEAIVHPAVRPRILAAIAAADAAGAPAVVIEAIKLVEGGLAALCDEVWLVTCTPDEQRARLRGRGMASDDADRRLASQGSIVNDLAPSSTRLLDTSGQPAAARERLAAAWGEATRLARPGDAPGTNNRPI
jgi:dephospho-CoA kinase